MKFKKCINFSSYKQTGIKIGKKTVKKTDKHRDNNILTLEKQREGKEEPKCLSCNT